MQRPLDCEAGVHDRDTCEADTSSGVVLVRQTGDGNCVLGRTWGFDAKEVWVADGCRGTFAFADDRVNQTGSTVAGARGVCEANTAAGVALASATYIAGTDDGFLGTGRAHQAVTYRHTFFNVLRTGGQLQFRTAEDTEEPRVFDDGVGTQGEEGIDVLAIGVHYGFSFKLFHRR